MELQNNEMQNYFNLGLHKALFENVHLKQMLTALEFSWSWRNDLSVEEVKTGREECPLMAVCVCVWWGGGGNEAVQGRCESGMAVEQWGVTNTSAFTVITCEPLSHNMSAFRVPN